MSLANTYRVVFSGNTLDGRSKADVSIRFANAFNLKDKDALERLFSGKTITLKRGLNYEQAQHYSEILQKLGADCCIEYESNPLFVQGDVDYDYERKKRLRVAQFSGSNFDNIELAPKV